MSLPMSAGRGVTEVITRCENAKVTGYLDLSSCSLMYIADAVYMKLKEHEITKVSVRDNCLKKFPKKFVTKFPTAMIFTIEGNQLTEFPEELGEWTTMRGFSAANNLLEAFPDGIYNMAALSILDLSSNKIRTFDVLKLYNSCSGLKHLSLDRNPLEEEVVSLLKAHKPEELVLKLD